MRWVTVQNKQVWIDERRDDVSSSLAMDFNELITPHAVHELLFPAMKGAAIPIFPALTTARLWLADQSSDQKNPLLTWVDSLGTFYPPAMLSKRSAERVLVLRPRPADLVWATVESLRCRSIRAVVAMIEKPLSRVEARRLQLAAETGGGLAVLIRPNLSRAGANVYAAATRWLVTPAPGEHAIQRWRFQLLHGHGCRVGQSFILEKHRASGQTHFMHLPPAMVDHAPMSAAS